MAMIKSALELALERTKNLEVDEVSIEAGRIKTEGRKTAGKFLGDAEAVDLAAAIAAIEAPNREHFRKSVFEVFLAQIQLPSSLFDAEKLAAIGSGLGAIARMAPAPVKGGLAGAGADKKAVALVQQISAFLAKYLEEVKRVEQAIRSQWAPKLKEKQRQMAARVGHDVHLDPMADPEFAAFYKQNFEALRANYSDALERAKGELTGLCGFEQEQGE